MLEALDNRKQPLGYVATSPLIFEVPARALEFSVPGAQAPREALRRSALPNFMKMLPTSF